jgi:methyl-accepting chemotaxis protein
MQFGLQAKLTAIFGLLTLTCVGIIVFVFFTLNELDGDAQVINVSGRQRMLSQKMTKETLFITNDIEREINLGNLRKTVDLFQQSTTGLIEGDSKLKLPPTEDSVTLDQLQIVVGIWEEMHPMLEVVISNPTDTPAFQKAVGVIRNRNLALLQEMNKAVGMYEAGSTRTVYLLKIVLSIGAALSLVLSVIGLLFVNRKVIKPLRSLRQTLALLVDLAGRPVEIGRSGGNATCNINQD